MAKRKAVPADDQTVPDLPETIEFRGVTGMSFSDRTNLRQLTEVLAAHPGLEPTHWDHMDGPRVKIAYKPDSFVREVAKLEADASIGVKFLRKKPPKHEGWFPIFSNSLCVFEMSLAVASKEDVRQAFAIGDALAAFLKPEWGVLHLRWVAGKKTEKYNQTYFTSGFYLQSFGPWSLCARTWTGQHITGLFGRENLVAAGVVCRDVPWGGLEIDLLPDPWASDYTTVEAKQKKVMKKLAPLGVFGHYRQVPVDMVAGANWKPIP